MLKDVDTTIVTEEVIKQRNFEINFIKSIYEKAIKCLDAFMLDLHVIDAEKAKEFFIEMCRCEFVSDCEYGKNNLIVGFRPTNHYEGRYPCLDAFISKVESLRYILSVLYNIASKHSDFNIYKENACMHILTDIYIRMTCIDRIIDSMNQIISSGRHAYAISKSLKDH